MIAIYVDFSMKIDHKILYRSACVFGFTNTSVVGHCTTERTESLKV